MCGADMAALYHYAPLDHALEDRASFADADLLPPGGFLLALGSIPWREAWKYGERAFRYCQLDAGHAIGAAAQAAAALGWRAHVLSRAVRRRNSRAAWPRAGRRRASARARAPRTSGLDRSRRMRSPRLSTCARIIDAARVWHGAANQLSEDHDGWPLVDLAFQLCRKPRGAGVSRPAAEGVFGRRR